LRRGAVERRGDCSASLDCEIAQPIGGGRPEDVTDDYPLLANVRSSRLSGEPCQDRPCHDDAEWRTAVVMLAYPQVGKSLQQQLLGWLRSFRLAVLAIPKRPSHQAYVTAQCRSGHVQTTIVS